VNFEGQKQAGKQLAAISRGRGKNQGALHGP
jgi:hypothetical protein